MNIFNIKQCDHIRSRIKKYAGSLSISLAYRDPKEMYEELQTCLKDADELLGAKKAQELLETVWTFEKMKHHEVYEIDIFKKAVEEFRESLITNSKNN